MRIRTGYSFRNAVGMLADVADRLKEIGMTHAPISDRASTFGFNRWTKEAKRVGLRPIYGVELAVSPEPQAKKPVVDYWTFFAKDDLRGIHDLIEKATSQFRYEPLLNYEQAMEAEDCIKIVGHRSRLEEINLADDLFIGWSPSCSKGYLNSALRAGHKFIPCSDNRFVREGDEGFYNVVCGRNSSLQSYPQWIMAPEEFIEHEMTRLGLSMCEDLALTETINVMNIDEIFKAKLKQADIYKPERKATLLDMCIEGARKLNCNIEDPVYAARLKHELTLIKEKDFEDYFYIIAEMVQWARERMVVGPARGSSCGSLVCYLLEITTIDPIPYGLIFERFIDINRSDLPDIDIDFSDTRRELVFDHMQQVYGWEHVARLGTVALYKPRSALNETGAALDIPPWEVSKVTESLIERSGGDSRALQALEDTFDTTPPGQELIKAYPEMRIAQRMEGHPRHHSQHAAGIVLTERPVKDFVAVDKRTGATMCDKKDAEDLNLLKIDALGLTQLSVFEDALEMAGLPMDHLLKIPLDDQAAFDVLNTAKFSGVFQYNGPALQALTKQITVSSLEDIISITALARPGPLNTGGATKWLDIKNKKRPREFIDPSVDEFLDSSSGIVIYQEQVMQIGRALGELSWEDVSSLRKAMSKSLGNEFFNQYAEKFLPTASAKIGAARAKELWDSLCAYGSWAFNRSHAVAYGMISYQCCWLKAHYPVEFAAATLNHESKPERQIAILREVAEEGIDYVPVDPETSINKWTAKQQGGNKAQILVGPIQNVKGIGPKLVAQIMSARARGEPIPDRAAKLLTNAKTPIDSLFPIKDALNRLLPDPTTKNIFTPPTRIIDIQPSAHKTSYLVYCILTKISPKDENELINVEKRGYAFKGPHLSLGLFIADDSDSIYAKINRYNYEKYAKEIINRGGPGKHLYALKCHTKSNADGFDMRMLFVDMVRYIGEV